MKFLENNKALRVSLSIILWLTIYAFVLIYLGFLKNLSFEDLTLLLDAGALSIIAFVGVKVLRFDATNNAFIAEKLSNDDLNKVDDELVLEIDKVTDDILAEEYMENLNEARQRIANKKLTKYVISKLRQELRDTRLRPKLSLRYKLFSSFKTKDDRIKDLERQLKFYLKDENYVVDKKCKPLKLKDILNVGSLVKVKEMTENEEHNYDPRKDSFWTWFMSIFKFVGLGSLSIPYAMANDDLEILPAYLTALTVTAGITVIRRYIQIRKRTAGPYLQARKKKLKRVKEIVKNEQDVKSQLAIKKNKEDTDKSLILKKDKDVVFTMDGTAYMIHRLDFVNPMESSGKYGFGDTYMKAYDHMLKEQKLEEEFMNFVDILKENLKYKKDEYIYTFDDKMGLTVEALTNRIESHNYIVKLSTDTFHRKPPILRIKKN